MAINYSITDFIKAAALMEAMIVARETGKSGQVYYEGLVSRAASKVEEFLVLGESCEVTTAGERMEMDFGITMVEATLGQCGEGHAGQEGDDEILLVVECSTQCQKQECFHGTWLQQLRSL